MTGRLRLISALRRFWRNTDGLAAIEFAILAPMLFFAFLAMVDVGLMIYEKLRLGQIVRDAAAAAMLTQDTSSISAAAQQAIAVAGSPISAAAYHADPVTLSFSCSGVLHSANALCSDGKAPRITLIVHIWLDHASFLFGTIRLDSALQVQKR